MHYRFAASFTELKFSENTGIESSGAYVLWISTGVFVCGSLGLLALSSKYPPDSMMVRTQPYNSNVQTKQPPYQVFFICSIYTTIASVAYLAMALGEGKLKEANITRALDNSFYVQNQIKLPVVFYPRCASNLHILKHLHKHLHKHLIKHLHKHLHKHLIKHLHKHLHKHLFKHLIKTNSLLIELLKHLVNNISSNHPPPPAVTACGS
jgi:hypothetical protein